MSDDVITSFLQSQPATNGGVKVGGEQINGSQDTDFKKIYSEEEKKISKEMSDGKTKDIGGGDGFLVNKKNKEAIKGFQEQQEPDLSGSGLPDLTVHNGALAVGRIVYTSRNIAVTTESLSKFMVRQNLVSEGLKQPTVTQTGGERVNDEKSGLDLTRIKHGEDLKLRSGLDPTVKANADKDSQQRDWSGQIGKEVLSQKENASKPESVIVSNESSNEPEAGLSLKSGSLSDKPEAGLRPNSGSLPDKPEIGLRLNSGSSPEETIVIKKGLIANGLSRNLQKEEGLELEISRKEKIGKGKIEPANISAQTGNSVHSGGGLVNTNEALNHNLSPLAEFSARARAKNSAETKAEPMRDGLLEGAVVKKKEQSLGNLAKNQHLERVEEQIAETRKGQAQGQSHLQRFLGEIKETVKVARETDNAKPVGSGSYNDASVKGLRDAGYHASQETVAQDSNQPRVEFKGALREAQRVVSTNVYNNLTDSYESWNSRFGEVLANRIAGHLSKENWNVHLKMNPASLGEISLEIDFSEKGLEGRLGANEESTRQLLQDTLPKLRLALREILEENQGLKLDLGDFSKSSGQDGSGRSASPSIIEDLDFESEVLVGNTLDPKLRAVVGLNILV